MRLTFRVPLQGHVHFSARSVTQPEAVEGEGWLQNASTGGVCFTTGNLLTPRDLIVMTVVSYGEQFIFKGEIIRVEESENGFNVGVRFDLDDPDTEQSLQMFATLGQDEELSP